MLLFNAPRKLQGSLHRSPQLQGLVCFENFFLGSKIYWENIFWEIGFIVTVFWEKFYWKICFGKSVSQQKKS